MSDAKRRAHEALEKVFSLYMHPARPGSPAATWLQEAHAAIDAIEERGHAVNCVCGIADPDAVSVSADPRCAASPGLEGSARGKVRQMAHELRHFSAMFLSGALAAQLMGIVSNLESALQGGGEDAK